MDWLREIFTQVRTGVAAMTAAQRASMVVLATIIALTMGMVVVLGARPKYVPVASGLDQAEMRDVVQLLDERGEKYKTDARQGAVLVAQDRKSVIDQWIRPIVPLEKTRGIDWYGDRTSGLGISQRERDKLYNVAVGGELKKMIMGLAGVEHARVQIKQESASEFGWKAEPVGVAVTVTTRRSVQIDQPMADSIIDLVHKAVRNCDPKEIVVVDNRTHKRFHREDPKSVVLRGARRLDLTRAVEDHFRRKFERFITQSGYEHTVAVTCYLDLKEARRSVYKVMPDETVLVTSERRKSTHIGATQSGGQTGMRPNPPGAIVVGSVTASGGSQPAKPSESKTSDDKARVDYSRLLEEINTTPGAIKTMRVSVILYDRVVQKKDDKTGKVELAYVSPKAEDLKKWEELLVNLANAADTTDLTAEQLAQQKRTEVVVANMPPRDVLGAVLETANLQDTLRSYFPHARIAGVFLLATFALFFLYGLGKRAASTRPVFAAPTRKEAAAPRSEQIEGEPEDAQFHEMQERIRTFVDQDPRKAAGLVKRWLVRES